MTVNTKVHAKFDVILLSTNAITPTVEKVENDYFISLYSAHNYLIQPHEKLNVETNVRIAFAVNTLAFITACSEWEYYGPLVDTAIVNNQLDNGIQVSLFNFSNNFMSIDHGCKIARIALPKKYIPVLRDVIQII